MRFPRVRFTVRRLMIVVAFVAIPFWAAHLWRLSNLHRVRAHLAAVKEVALLKNSDTYETMATKLRDLAGSEGNPELSAAWLEKSEWLADRARRNRLRYVVVHHFYLRSQYLVFHPWLTGPDPTILDGEE
jgi:hypothetical protein